MPTPDGYIWQSLDDAKRVARATRAVERMAPPPLQRAHPLPQSRQQWHKAENSSGADIGAYAIVDVTDATEEARPTFSIAKPGTTFRRLWAVVGPQAIPDGGTGRITFGPIVRCLHATTPSVQDIGGPKGNDTTNALYRGQNYGFQVLAPVGDGTCICEQHTVDRIRVKTPGGGITAGSSATCDVLSNLDVDINFNVTVYNKSAVDAAASTNYDAVALGGRWHLAAGFSTLCEMFKDLGVATSGDIPDIQYILGVDDSGVCFRVPVADCE